MPTCSKCGRFDTSAEMRRSTKKAEDGGTLWMCKDKPPCDARRREARIQERAQKKTERRVRRRGYQD